MKKRNIVIGLFALDLLALPAAAQMIDTVKFEAPQKAVSVVLSNEPGLTKFVLTSNAPFTIVSENAVSEFDIYIQDKGFVNGNKYGENAQLPGSDYVCASALTPAKSAIYRATRKTAKSPGEILSQAVVVSIRYDESVSPDFKILPADKTRNVPRAAPCAQS